MTTEQTEQVVVSYEVTIKLSVPAERVASKEQAAADFCDLLRDLAEDLTPDALHGDDSTDWLIRRIETIYPANMTREELGLAHAGILCPFDDGDGNVDIVKLVAFWDLDEDA